MVGIAMDAASPGEAAKLYEKAGVKFKRGLDGADALFETLGFDVVPNGLFVDENGIVRYQKFGGFEARVESDRQAIEKLLAAPVSRITAPSKAAKSAPKATAAGPSHWFRLGVSALERGDKETAAKHWRKALELDPKNFVIRKQIWALEHPEQFYPAINPSWQREQLAKERSQEAGDTSQRKD